MGSPGTVANAMGIAEKLMGDKGEPIITRSELAELVYFSDFSARQPSYHDACRVVYRLGMEAEYMWRETHGQQTPTDDLLARLTDREYMAQSGSKDKVIFDRLKKVVDEEIADRPGNGLRYLFDMGTMIREDPWARDVQRKLSSMDQWTNIMMYAYTKIFEKIDRWAFDVAVEQYGGFKTFGYWDNGTYIPMEEKVVEMRRQRNW